MENIILLVYIYSSFHLRIFTLSCHTYIYIILYSGVVSEWLWSWVLQIFDPRWLNNPVRLTLKVNSTKKKFSDGSHFEKLRLELAKRKKRKRKNVYSNLKYLILQCLHTVHKLKLSIKYFNLNITVTYAEKVSMFTR